MSQNLEEIWNELTKDLPDEKNDWWFKIVEKLNDSKRKCHNLSYLEKKFALYESVKHLIKNKAAVRFALFFSYFEYGPIILNSHERNINHFQQFATECKISQDSILYKDVVMLLQCTGSCITEEHKQAGVYGCEDKHYFLDLDMVILGSEPDVYAEYWDKEREEYDFLPVDMYNSLRVKVLRTFLLIPNIFATKEFRDKYEENARKNIQADVSLINE
ncbi:uncharacterized protein LOC106671364 isoform X2 [Cimex lectularius]|uniref:Uncharacterized protein n=1 Tax=Cimex lectularius TaxID=79782 RepID=A0A8I6S7Z4_CIMLE|nr:uncharacterized protein LOC106671364 isoform X2 [Cimex lectularius]